MGGLAGCSKSEGFGKLHTNSKTSLRISGKMENGENLPKPDQDDPQLVTGEREDSRQNQQVQQKPQRTPAFANQLPPSVSQQRTKPKRSTNALHLLFLEASKLVSKVPSEILSVS